MPCAPAAVSAAVADWDAIPDCIRRPCCVYKEHMEDVVAGEVTSNAIGQQEATNRLAAIQSLGAAKAFEAIDDTSRRQFVQVSLAELSAYTVWTQSSESTGCVKDSHRTAPMRVSTSDS